MIENGKTKALALIIVLFIVGTIMGVAVATISYTRGKELAEKKGFPFKDTIERRIFTVSFMASVILNSVNIFLLIGLLGVYMHTYTKTKSGFMLGLIFFIGVLLIQSILSLPPLHILFGYTNYGLGPFGFLPHLFETLAIIILLMLSLE